LFELPMSLSQSSALRLLILVPTGLLTFMSHAQMPPTAASILRQVEAASPQLAPKAIAPAAIATPERRLSPPVEGGARVRVRSIRFVGGEGWVKAEDLFELVRPALGQSWNVSDLTAFTEQVSSALKSRGWLLAQAYLPPQDVTTGEIEVRLMPGMLDGGLEGVVVSGAQRVSAERIRAMVAAPIQAQQMRLNAQGLEEGLLRAGELSGVSVTASLDRGAQPGSSRLTIEAQEAPFVGGGLTLDNFGGPYTGVERATGLLTLNSPLGLGDSLLLNAVGSSGIAMLTTQMSVPVGDAGLKLGGSLTTLRYRVGGDMADLGLQGRALMWGLNASYPLYLTPGYKLRARFGFDRKAFVDSAAGELLGDKVAQVVSLGLSGQTTDGWLGGGMNDWSLGIERGHMDLSRLAAVLEQDQAGARTHGDFHKWLYAYKRMQPLAGRWMAQVSLNGQQAARNLEGSEKFSLGGNSGIRAYPGGEGAGDTGMVASLTVTHPWVLPTSSYRLELSGFYDWGRIRVHHSGDQLIDSASGLNRYSLSGVGLGLNLSQPGAWSLALTWAQALGRNPGRSTDGNNSDGKAGRSRVLMVLNVDY
jgi:hemolysin activation/secretion protein